MEQQVQYLLLECSELEQKKISYINLVSITLPAQMSDFPTVTVGKENTSWVPGYLGR